MPKCADGTPSEGISQTIAQAHPNSTNYAVVSVPRDEVPSPLAVLGCCLGIDDYRHMSKLSNCVSMLLHHFGGNAMHTAGQ